MEKSIFGWIILVSGVGIIFFWVYMLRRALYTYKWPHTVAEIISAKVTRASTTSNSNSWEPTLSYSYRVNNVLFWGNRIKFTSSTYPLPKLAQRKVDKYPIDSKINVYYDPLDPSKSLIINGVPLGLHGILIAGLALISVGLFLLLK